MVGEVTQGSVQAGHSAGLTLALGCLALGHLRRYCIDAVPSSSQTRLETWWCARPLLWVMDFLCTDIGGSQCA